MGERQAGGQALSGRHSGAPGGGGGRAEPGGKGKRGPKTSNGPGRRRKAWAGARAATAVVRSGMGGWGVVVSPCAGAPHPELRAPVTGTTGERPIGVLRARPSRTARGRW